MARTPSYNLLAKDAIGQAVNIAGVQLTQDRTERINDYNMALAELYNILGYIDTDVYTVISFPLGASMNGFNKMGIIDLATITNWDKILAVEAGTNADPSLPLDNLEEVPYSLLSSHKGFRVAIDPYDESIIYSIVGNKIHFLIGESLDYTFNSILFTIVYRKQPSILTLTNWNTEKVDLPDKYWSLLVNRIASLIEYRAGIFDKSLAMVKLTYEQLLANVEPIIKSTMLESLKTPVGAIQ